MRNYRRPKASLVVSFPMVLAAAGGCAGPSSPGEDDEPLPLPHPYPFQVSVSIERETQNPDVRLWIDVSATNVTDSTLVWHTDGYCIVGFLIRNSVGETVGGGWDCQTVPMSWPFAPGETRETHGSWAGTAPRGKYHVIGGLITGDELGLAYPDTLVLNLDPSFLRTA